MGDLLTVPQFASALCVKPGTVRAWIWRGTIKYVRISRRCVRIPRTELTRLTKNIIPAKPNVQAV